MHSMLLKELRENAKWIAIGLAIMLALTWAALPTSIANYSNSLKQYLGFAGALFAMLLGTVQSAWDFSDRQQGFLLHRTLSSKQILIAKILAGFIIYAIVMGIPLLIAACYFAMMGPEYLPVRPLQVVAPVLLVSLCYLLHPIAIFTQIRKARWFGTKALPVVLPVSLCYFFYLVHDNRWQSWAMFALLGLILVVLSLGIFSRNAETFSIIANALTSLAIAISLCGVFLLSNPRTPTYDEPGLAQGIDSNGALWEYRYRQKYEKGSLTSVREILSGSPVVPGKQPDLDSKVPTGLALNSMSLLVPTDELTKNYGQIWRSAGVGDIIIFWDERGYLLVYDVAHTNRLLGTITRDGFSPGVEPKGRLFSSSPFNLSAELQYVGRNEKNLKGMFPSFLMADSNGIYLLNQATGELNTVVDKPVTAATSLINGEDHSDSFLVETEAGLERYQLQTTLPVSDEKQLEEPQPNRISFNKIATYARLPKSSTDSWSIGASPDGKLAALKKVSSDRYILATVSSSAEAQWKEETVQIVPQQTQSQFHLPGVAGVLGAAPLILVVLAATSIFINVLHRDQMTPFADYLINEVGQRVFLIYFLAFAISTLIALALTYSLIRSRTTDRKTILLWLAATIPLGLAAPLAIVAIYSKLVFESCSKCHRVRRVDRAKCEHCGSGWESLPVQGIELVESQQFNNVPTVVSTVHKS